MERRLTTILAADVVGYSRLMGTDDAGTLTALKALRRELIKPKETQYHGRTVKLMGDGALMEFASVVDAVTFAVEVQVAMAARNAEVTKDRWIVYRIGLNIGDIIVEGDDIYGDGVNVAARLEGLCEPGGVCVSRNVYNQVKDKLDLTFEDLGEKAVKNIAEPVSVYRIPLDQKATALATPITVSIPQRGRGRWPQIAAGFALSVVAIASLVWWQPWAPDVEPASVEAMAFPLPDKPSIAVLPFNNMSDDQAQEYFADGMTEDLITDLSKISGLFVIARNSSFSYKGQQVKVRQVAEELGVRYVLEGSVRRAGNEVRINAQLIDATTGGHVWAQRYDGTLEDIFGLQDQVTQQIVTALSVSLTVDEQAERTQTETENVTAYDAFMRGWELYRRGTVEDFAAAIPFLKDAVKLDPDYGRAYAALAAVYWNSMWNVWNRSLGLGQQQAVVLVQKYLREAKRHPSPLAYQVASEYSAHYRPRPAKALSDAERAISLDANNPAGYLALANALIKAKRPAEAVANMREAMRLDPHYPAFYLTRLGQAQFAMGRFQDAATTFERAAGRNPNDDWNFIYLAATYAHLERESEAKNAIAKANELRSSMNRAPVSLKELSSWVFRWTGDKESLRAGLVKAGAGHGRTEWTQLVTSGESGYEIDGATIIDVAAAKALHDRGVIFIDIYFMWLVEHIPGAHYVDEDTDEFVESELLQIVEKGQEVVIYGGDSRRAANASAMAVTWGFEKVYYFRDGTQGWKSAGYPLEGWKAE